jgi:hypothetical protein
MPDDKQLRGVRVKDVLKKRRLDQASNAKEFAVLAGVSCSTTRGRFHLAAFPVFRGSSSDRISCGDARRKTG